MKKIELSEKNVIKIIFFSAFLLYMLLGIMLTYNYDFSNNYNLLFDADHKRVINDMTKIVENHYRTTVHPLFILIVQPVFYFVKGIVLNNMIAIIAILSFVSSLTAVYLYKILSLFSKDKLSKALITICYILSFSNYIFTAGIELYNIAVLFLIMLWYFFLKKNSEKEMQTDSTIILTALGILSLSITITNYIIFLIILFFLFISKKISLKKAILINIIILLMAFFLISVQGIIWPKTRQINLKEENNFIKMSVGINEIINVFHADFYNSIIGDDVEVVSINGKTYNNANYRIQFSEINLINLTSVILFYIFLITLVIRNFKKNKLINIAIILAILFNTILHTIYGNDVCFLYSLHFLYLIFMLFGINLLNDNNIIIKKIAKIYLGYLIIMQLVINSMIFEKVIKITSKVLQANNNFILKFGIEKVFIASLIIIILVMALINLIIRFINKMKEEKNKDKQIINTIVIALLVLTINCIFIFIEKTNSTYKDEVNSILQKETGDVIVNKVFSKEFKDYFAKEIKDYDTYKKEYKNYIKRHNVEKVTVSNENNFYFYGMGNRRKLLFLKGSLIDIETSETIYNFNPEEYLIIPNKYTIILRSKNKEFIKIYENNSGVYISKNDRENILIDGTDSYINLYNFDNQKYQNIKKVLYSEILFNIKESIIYPNIIVYDNPWYRDAALGAMVLKQTGNEDLIKDWINNISEVYDLQNKGIKEPDNLGELLYLISTQKEKNTELINKIIEEAEYIASNNQDGYYLKGKTDFSDHFLYQNLWYKFGMNSINREFKFNIDSVYDDYAQMAWWSGYKDSNKEEQKASINYPYLSWASFHTLKKGKLPMNENLYPLSWEMKASEANYDNMSILSDKLKNKKISPLHTWTASEMLLTILDETGNLTNLN